jgi:hypothetical protein
MNDKSEISKEELEKIKCEINNKVRDSLNEEGLFGLAVFTLENFAYRYLETINCTNIKAQKISDSHFFVESIETEPLKALKISNPEAKKGLISLAKRFSSAKGEGIQVKQELHINFKDLSSSGSGNIECFSKLNWNIYNNFKDEEGLFVKKSINLEFDEPILLRNKLALLLENVCEIF